MKTRPIKRASISEQVFDQLKQKIIEGEWVQGEKLPSENDLAESFQVSRVTIRHAIHKLAALGLVETKLGEGTFIKELSAGTAMYGMIPAVYLSPRDTMEVLDFRYVLEVETAGLAAERRTPEDIAALKRQLEVMLSTQKEPEAFSDADLDFHMMVARATHNSLIIETYGILRDILVSCMKETVGSLGVEIGIPYHRQLIAAMERCDAEQAKEVMRTHMDSTRKEFAHTVRPSGKPDDAKDKQTNRE